MRKVFEDLVYSLPFQLVFHHIKKNLPLLAVWILFVATVFGGIGRVYGIHFLFLDPEYLNKVGFWSFFIIGLAYGNLTMAFHITCYILDSHHFSFIGILERPFAKFSVNNSIIPLLTLIIYVVAVIHFRLTSGFATFSNLIMEILGLLLGMAVMCVIMFAYFRFTNQDIFRFLTGSVDKRLRKSRLSRERMMSRLKETRQKRYQVTNYYDLNLRKRSCEDLMDFYDKDAILKVFDQNHFNSVVIELAVIVVLLLLGSFMDNAYLQIPAAASCLLIFSVIIMLMGAVSYWFRQWTMAFVLGLFILMNILVEAGLIDGTYQARGLDYDTIKADYSLENLQELNAPVQYLADKNNMIQVLENWKAKQEEAKPRIIFQCISGGGQRAALWAVNSLQKADSVLNGNLMDKTFLITGASGGLIGGAYYRELRMREEKGEAIDPYAPKHLENIGKDNLNAIIFSLLVNDLFFRVRHFEYEGETYTRDRGYVFERSLNRNLEGLLNKKLADYSEAERQAEIPLMIMSPVIANDGRKLFISTQPVAFMNVSSEIGNMDADFKIRGVDFNQLFEAQQSENLHFLAALRMSASFPYITPTVSLPSTPRIEIMDAGISDNYGVSDALRFLFVFREWIEKNTSGVVMLIIRDTRKIVPIDPRSNPSIVDRFTYPIISVYNNLGNIQDITNDSRIEATRAGFAVPVDLVELEYNTYTLLEDRQFLNEARAAERKQMERASLSWHLTTREKQNIIQNIQRRNNQRALKKLKFLMSDEHTAGQ